jgi:hypothetical protein
VKALIGLLIVMVAIVGGFFMKKAYDETPALVGPHAGFVSLKAAIDGDLDTAARSVGVRCELRTRNFKEQTVCREPNIMDRVDNEIAREMALRAGKPPPYEHISETLEREGREAAIAALDAEDAAREAEIAALDEEDAALQAADVASAKWESERDETPHDAAAASGGKP